MLSQICNPGSWLPKLRSRELSASPCAAASAGYGLCSEEVGSVKAPLPLSPPLPVRQHTLAAGGTHQGALALTAAAAQLKFFTTLCAHR